MPTGYTAKMYDGEDQSFEDFVWACARSFGALVELRDSPNAEIPVRFEPSEYHRDALRTAEDEFDRWHCISDAAAAADLGRAQGMALAANQKLLTLAEERRSRYEARLAEVRAWEPPTDEHVALKAFMIEQITESIMFDCKKTYLSTVPEDNVQAWRESRLDAAQRNIVYHAEQYAKECERAARRTAWVRSLQDSLEKS